MNSGIKREDVSIRQFLLQLVGDEEKVNLPLRSMDRVECKQGETLFEQGEPDDGFYLVESGTLSAFIGKGEGRARQRSEVQPRLPDWRVVGLFAGQTPHHNSLQARVDRQHFLRIAMCAEPLIAMMRSQQGK